MKKFLSLFLFSFFLLAGSALIAQCPFGKDVCHGECGRFTDANDNGLCDFCKQEQNTVKTPEKTQETKAENKGFSPRLDNKDSKTEKEIEKVAPSKRKQFLGQEEQKDSIENADSDVVEAEVEQVVTQTKEPKTQSKPYKIIIVLIITLAIYALSALLVKQKVMKKVTHRKIWNMILLITFIIACLMGVLLALQMNYGFWMGAYRKLLFLHVEIGIVMTIVGIIHCLWHLTYWKNLVAKH
jgi:hypothetical protein